MTQLLDRFIPITTAFRPSTARELFALHLAQKLNDAAAVRHYVDLTDTHSEPQLLSAYRRTIRANAGADTGRLFHAELKATHGNGQQSPSDSLIAIRIERRTIAAAVFHGEHMEYTDARQLSSDRDKAVASTAGFIGWLLSRFAVESAAVESIVNGHEIQRRALHDLICSTLREQGLPIWEIPKSVLLDGYGHPPVKSRTDLRQIAITIWPILAGTNAKLFIQDAAALGLHVQTERLFIIS